MSATFCAAVHYYHSAREDPTKIGTDLLPESDFVTIKSTDTLSVWSYTMFDDSVRTDNPQVSHFLDNL